MWEKDAVTDQSAPGAASVQSQRSAGVTLSEHPKGDMLLGRQSAVSALNEHVTVLARLS